MTHGKVSIYLVTLQSCCTGRIKALLVAIPQLWASIHFHSCGLPSNSICNTTDHSVTALYKQRAFMQILLQQCSRDTAYDLPLKSYHVIATCNKAEHHHRQQAAGVLGGVQSRSFRQLQALRVASHQMAITHSQPATKMDASVNSVSGWADFNKTISKGPVSYQGLQAKTHPNAIISCRGLPQPQL